MKNKQILSKVRENREELINFATKLINFKTSNPPGENYQRAQKWFAKKLQEIGMKVETFEIYPNEPNVISLLEGLGKKTLIFNGHMDVAQVKESEKWNFDPFNAKYDKEFLYGRGSTDMKGGLAAVYIAIKTLCDNGFDFNQNIMFQSVVGEEAGEHGTKMALEKGYTGDFAIVPEPNNLKIQGQGGAITLWIKLKSDRVYHDGTRRKLIHAGGGIEGASMIEKACKILIGMQDLEKYWSVMKKYPGMPPGANTINPSVINGGRNPAFIADECKVWYSIHFLPNEKVEEVKKEVSTHIEKVSESDPWLRNNPPKLEWGGNSLFKGTGEVFPSAEIEIENCFVQSFIKNYEDIFGKNPKPSIWPSVSDAGWFSEFGIPVVICGPGRIEEAHSVNEKVEIDQLIKAAELYASYIINFCEER